MTFQDSITTSKFLITGGAGFIGSNIAENLVSLNASQVTVIDNLSTGNISNIDPLRSHSNFTFVEGDINESSLMDELTSESDIVLHQAALGSVPRSIKDPLSTHEANATGFLSVLESCRKSEVKRLVYASSSSVYGDSKELPKVESRIGNPKSPYAITKHIDEQYAQLYSRIHNLETIGLRYFNIFGPNQSPNGPYAAAIPLFIMNALSDKAITVYGDGEQSRDFTYVSNAVKANIYAAFADSKNAGEVFNIACGQRYTLNEVIQEISAITEKEIQVEYSSEREGDIRHSHASIDKAIRDLDYTPDIQLSEGLRNTVKYFLSKESIKV